MNNLRFGLKRYIKNVNFSANQSPINTQSALIKTWLLGALLSLALTPVLQAQFKYSTNIDGTINIAGFAFNYTFPGGPLIIPETINGLPVTTIGSGSFQNTSIASVTFGSNVTTIGDTAFFDCYSLSNIVLPNSIRAIGIMTFDSCSSLADVIFPNGLTNIGNQAFIACTSLSEVTIPNSVAIIGDNAFRICTGLVSATIGTGVAYIGNGAFLGPAVLQGFISKATLPILVRRSSLGTILSRSIFRPVLLAGRSSPPIPVFRLCCGMRGQRPAARRLACIRINLDSISSAAATW